MGSLGEDAMRRAGGSVIKIDIPIDDPRAHAWVKALSQQESVTHEGRAYWVAEIDWDRDITTVHFILQPVEAAE
jgi:hypothetical protein